MTDPKPLPVLPDGLPPLPKPPAGHRWVYRDTGWTVVNSCTFAYLEPGSTMWNTMFGVPSGRPGVHYAEAVPLDGAPLAAGEGQNWPGQQDYLGTCALCGCCYKGEKGHVKMKKCHSCHQHNLEGQPRTREELAENSRELDKVAPTPAHKFALMLGLPVPQPAPPREWDGQCCFGLACAPRCIDAATHRSKRSPKLGWCDVHAADFNPEDLESVREVPAQGAGGETPITDAAGSDGEYSTMVNCSLGLERELTAARAEAEGLRKLLNVIHADAECINIDLLGPGAADALGNIRERVAAALKAGEGREHE